MELGERLVILDFNHRVHQYVHGNAPRFYHTIDVAGVPTRVETTIPAYEVKNLYRISRRGKDIVAVCFDSPCPSRKQYFSKNRDGSVREVEYKDGRKQLQTGVYAGIGIHMDLLAEAGVPVYKVYDSEADDLVGSLIKQCKEVYPNTPIDIVCNDADLLPLVDEQVSVFIRSKRLTWAIDPSIKKKDYWQITPQNYGELMSSMNDYKKFDVPYNTILLHKLLRGDNSDVLPKQKNKYTGKNDYPPKVYNMLLQYLKIDNVQDRISQGFLDSMPYCSNEHKEMLLSMYRRNDGLLDLGKVFKYGGTEQLDTICNILSPFIDEDDIEHIRYMYIGMNLKQTRLKVPVKYDVGRLRVEASKLAIKIPLD